MRVVALRPSESGWGGGGHGRHVRGPESGGRRGTSFGRQQIQRTPPQPFVKPLTCGGRTCSAAAGAVDGHLPSANLGRAYVPHRARPETLGRCPYKVNVSTTWSRSIDLRLNRMTASTGPVADRRETPELRPGAIRHQRRPHPGKRLGAGIRSVVIRLPSGKFGIWSMLNGDTPTFGS